MNIQKTDLTPKAPQDVVLGLIMMQKDEGPLLEAWLRYHERLTPPTNIWVLDNGSSDPQTLAALADAEARGLRVIRDYPTNSDYQVKDEIFVRLIGQMQDEGADFTIPLDCDEFLICRNDDIPASFAPEELRAVIADALTKPGHFMMRGSYYNVTGRAQSFVFGQERSVCFGRSRVTGLDHGYHNARTVDDQVQTIDLAMLHFQAKRLEISKRQATEKLRKRVKNFSPEWLESYTGAGSHMKKWFIAPPADSTETKGRTMPGFARAMEEVGVTFPFGMFFQEDRYGESRAILGDDPVLPLAVEHGIPEKEALLIHHLGRNSKHVLFYAPAALARRLPGDGAGRVDVLSLSSVTLASRLPADETSDEPRLHLHSLSLRVAVDGFGKPSRRPPQGAVRDYTSRALDRLPALPDLAVVNGRYRLACVAALALRSRDIRLIVPNFWSREEYHPMLGFCGCLDTEGDTVVLKPDADVTAEALSEIYEAALDDFR